MVLGKLSFNNVSLIVLVGGSKSRSKSDEQHVR